MEVHGEEMDCSLKAGQDGGNWEQLYKCQPDKSIKMQQSVRASYQGNQEESYE